MSGTVNIGSITVTSMSAGNISVGPYTFPSTEPVKGSVLVTDGTGNLSFSPANTRVEVSAAAHVVAASEDIVAITVAQDTALTLPDPATKVVGNILYVVKEAAGAHVVTIAPSGAELISGQTSHVLSSEYGAAKLYTNGTDWFILT
ncbi:unnamed protein product [Pylaiella littoralis]